MSQDIKPMTLDEVCKLWSDANHEHMKGHGRFGQAIFNLLHDRRPDLARKIAGGKLDPFHKFPEDGDVFGKLWTFLRTGEDG